MKTIIAISITVVFAIIVTSVFADRSKPNIIHLLCDEIASHEPGGMGGKDPVTPNMDQLAASGMMLKELIAFAPASLPPCISVKRTLLLIVQQYTRQTSHL